MTPEITLIFSVFVMLVLQLLAIAILARIFASKSIEKAVAASGAAVAALVREELVKAARTTAELAEHIQENTKLTEEAKTAVEAQARVVTEALHTIPPAYTSPGHVADSLKRIDDQTAAIERNTKPDTDPAK